MLELRKVNLVDLMDSRRLRHPVRIFLSKGELEKYTKDKKRVFPLGSAKAGGIVRVLLEDFRQYGRY